MRIVFMGTADFAVPCLKALHGAGYEIAGVVTQPDRPKGRGRNLSPPPVKEAAQALGLPVFQPEKVKAPESIKRIEGMQPDCIVVVAYGQLLPDALLELAPYGCINVHASLLPEYRGGAPMHRAIMDGKEKTGVTTMFVSRKLDAGDIILQSPRLIPEEMTVGELHDLLAADGAQLLLETLALLQKGEAPRRPQEEEKATYAPLLTRADEWIDWRRPAKEVANQVRGMDPWPGAYTRWQGKNLKIWKAQVVPQLDATGAPGTVVALDRAGVLVACGDGQGILVKELQLAGKKRMTTEEFIKGNPLVPGTILGCD
ncbi:MAG TPA: methionyl-tRNA formyltransferase [Clostridia bacterium]|nr:methionyl-tRNA formyltransferase [Clostridia bacterium]